MRTKEILEKIKFKEGVDNRLEEIHCLLFMVLIDMAIWLDREGYETVVTSLVSTLEEDISLGRESDAHRTFRALDLRSRHMKYEDRERFKTFFNNKYRKIASISRSDLIPRIVVEHGTKKTRHFHVALNFIHRITE